MRKIINQWGIPIIIGLILMLTFKSFVCYFPKWFAQSYTEIFQVKIIPKNEKVQLTNSVMTNIDQNVTGPIGDTFGGTLGPIIAMIAAYLTFLAFWVQYRANKEQEKYIKQQRFEDTFFRLIDLHRRNLDTIDIREKNDETRIIATGTDSFRSMYEDFERGLKKSNEISKINETYDILQTHYRHDFHHYFRFLYHMLKFIKNSDIKEDDKHKYASILRAMLSAYELVFVFYNALHPNGNTHFKPLVEYFSFLKNMDKSLLFNQEQINDFHKIAFSSSKERKDWLKDWLKINAT